MPRVRTDGRSDCVVCGKPAFVGVSGKPSMYCSETCRKLRYAARCVDCGAVCNTDGRRARPSKRCATCQRARQVEAGWQAEQLIALIREHAERNGGIPPTVVEWWHTTPERPGYRTFVRVFGSWTDAIRAAGYEPHWVGRKPSEFEIERAGRMYDDGASYQEIADALGVREGQVHWILYRAGRVLHSNRRHRSAA